MDTRWSPHTYFVLPPPKYPSYVEIIKKPMNLFLIPKFQTREFHKFTQELHTSHWIY